MPLDRYGVLAGVLQSHYRDQPDTQGRWYHVNLKVNAPGGEYRCAIDIDSKQSSTGVEWKTLTVGPSALGPATALEAGYHDVASSPDSGALDYIRHPALSNNSGCLFVRQPPPWLQDLLNLFLPRRLWKSGSNLDASMALESILQSGHRILVFGEPFTVGLGMHNVHQNQGDPAGSQWWSDNGTWQDGGVAIERPDGRFDIFISKFSTQVNRTDDAGHPD